MKILSMTATFGKLNGQALQLQPGLNVITAPNEWGKSTWSAFILAMFYGIDTGSRRKKDAIPDKEHYAPWSGKPMSGRMELEFNGRNITIERNSRGRTPFGEFQAYETDTGLKIPELTGENCGMVLLGVEKSVFQRSGFLRLQDLPVTEDEALRNRLNALVTTGDESGTEENLEKKLRELKNKIHHNTTGLLPQQEKEVQLLQGRIHSLQQMENQLDAARQESTKLSARKKALENHLVHLSYEKNLSYRKQAEETAVQLEKAKQEEARLDILCRELPAEGVLRRKLAALGQLREKWERLQREENSRIALPEKPVWGIGETDPRTPEEAQKDAEEYGKLTGCRRKNSVVLWILTAVMILAGGTLLMCKRMVPAVSCLVLGVIAFIAATLRQKGIRRTEEQRKDKVQKLRSRYGSLSPDLWKQRAQEYADAWAEYGENLREYEKDNGETAEKRKILQQQTEELTEGKSILATDQEVRDALQLREQFREISEKLAELQKLAETFSAGTGPEASPDAPDSLTVSQSETENLLYQLQQEQQKLQEKTGRLQGQMDSLGSRDQLENQLIRAEERTEKLRKMETALLIADKTRELAEAELQRRFAPRISARAQQILIRLTGKRYDRLLLDKEFHLQTGAQDEHTLRSSLWHSDGTADQLYLALRLAVAEELTPEAPIVLDDALVRFDDERLKSALQILGEEPKQVILFTCQRREENILAEL